MKLRVILKKLPEFKEENNSHSPSNKSKNNNFLLRSNTTNKTNSRNINSSNKICELTSSVEKTKSNSDLTFEYSLTKRNNNIITNVSNSNRNFTGDITRKNSQININITYSNNNISYLNSPNDNSILNSPNFNYLPNNKIADLKYFISSQFGIKIDSLNLYKFTVNLVNNSNYNIKNFKINDNEELSNYINENDSKINTHLIFFYDIIINENIEIINVNIEYFQNNIDKIIFKLNHNCQIYLLKYLISKRLNNNLPIEEQSLVFQNSGIVNNNLESNENKNPINNNIIYNNINLINTDKNNIHNIKNKIQIFHNSNSSINSKLKKSKEIIDQKTLQEMKQDKNHNLINFLLIRKGEKKCSMGLDFSFILMRNINKIPFQEEAPSFRSASDGLNIFSYCKNKNCKIFNQMFVRNFGFNKFDIMKEIKFIYCPKCFDSKNVEVRNVGFVNCEWNYKGIMSNKNNSIIHGDGVTTDNKLYVMKETNLTQQISKLEILIKPLSFNCMSDKNIVKYETNDSSASVDPLEDIDVPFSIKRKDLFSEKDHLSNQKIYQNEMNISKDCNNNLSKILFNSEVDNSQSQKDSDFNMKRDEDVLDIILDNKRKNICCNNLDKFNCIIY